MQQSLRKRIEQEGGTPVEKLISIKRGEGKIRHLIKTNASRQGLSKFIGKVIIPRRRIWQIRAGKRISIRKKMFPGYMIIQMIPTAEAIHLVHSTPGVLGLLPLQWNLKGHSYLPKEPKKARKAKSWEYDVLRNWKPKRLNSKEEAMIALGEKAVKTKPQTAEVDLKMGDRVLIKSKKSPYDGMKGYVKAVTYTDPTNPKIDVTLTLGIGGVGIPTVVSFHYWEVVELHTKD